MTSWFTVFKDSYAGWKGFSMIWDTNVLIFLKLYLSVCMLISNSNVIQWFLSYHGIFVLGFNYVKTHSYPALGYSHVLVPGVLPLFRITTPDTHCFDDLTSTFNFNLRLPISCVGNLHIRLASWISCTNLLNVLSTQELI